MTVHHTTYKGRKITIAIERCDDGKYCIKGVQVEVRQGDNIVDVDMPYLGIVDADESKVVEKAKIDASVYVRKSLLAQRSRRLAMSVARSGPRSASTGDHPGSSSAPGPRS
jgi:hypothetical protein